MKKEIILCEICKKEVSGEEQLRKENWIRIRGGSLKGIEVWLKKPRKEGESYMLHIGWQERDYDFCSIKCLVKALKGKESI